MRRSLQSPKGCERRRVKARRRWAAIVRVDYGGDGTTIAKRCYYFSHGEMVEGSGARETHLRRRSQVGLPGTHEWDKLKKRRG